MILTFYFDYSSPFAYLASTQIETLATRHKAELRWAPMLLGGLFKAIGGPDVPLFAMPDAKKAHARLDIFRYADHYGVPFNFPSRFPMNTVNALRMTLQLSPADTPRLVHPLFRAYWVEDRDLSDRAELQAIANKAGFDGEALLAGCADPALKSGLRDATEAAVARGLCGAPSFVVQRDNQDKGFLFWGQDRLEFVGRALDGWCPASG